MYHKLLSAKATLLKIMPEGVVSGVRKYRRKAMFEAFRQKGVIFFHVPRTGGTSIGTALYGSPVNHFSVSELNPLLPDEFSLFKRFAVVRNPWDRAVSAWAFARSGLGDPNPSGNFIARPYLVPEFETFDRFVEEWLATRKLAKLATIFQLQTSFLINESDELTFDHLGRFEDLSATGDWLVANGFLTDSLPHLNASPRKDYRKYYTPALRDKIAAIYARDIELLGYSF